jgi:hypothetical protein
MTITSSGSATVVGDLGAHPVVSRPIRSEDEMPAPGTTPWA